MAQAKKVQLPQMLRNPIVALEISEELDEWAEVVEKLAAEEGRAQRSAGRVRKLKAVAKQLRKASEARIGDDDDD